MPLNDTNQRQYNDPIGGDQSTIGDVQFNEFYYQKKALIEAKKTQFFSQMADVTAMPKHMGKTIKRYHYLPLLDDANINDQGIDAAGLSNAQFKATIKMSGPNLLAEPGAGVDAANSNYSFMFFVGEGNSAANATTAAQARALSWANSAQEAGGLGLAAANYAEVSTTGGSSAYDLGYRFYNDTAGDAVPFGGNLYGSSKDVGTISSKLPALSETGGRVNRVGFRRVEIEGTIAKFGFFDEYTQESMDFDTDSELMMHVNREMINGASEMTEDAIQIDLLNGAGVVRFSGDATSHATVTGEGVVSEVTYEDLMKLAIDLDNNRTPKNTKLISGTRLIDTKTIDGARYLYCGSEMIPTLRAMKDLHNNPAFIPVQHYAAGGNLAEGEIGSIDQFRIIIVPEMMRWEGEGAAVGTNPGYRETGGKYDVYPMLVVGSGSFTTIGFQTDGKTVKFKVKHSKPGSPESYANDPYGETGFMSIKWYYGSMVLRPERLAVIKTVAQY